MILNLRESNFTDAKKQMDLTTFANQLIFPLILFILFLSFFHLEPRTLNYSVESKDSLASNLNYVSELEKFYDTVNQDNNLIFQLEAILEKENYIEELVSLGKALGYEFTSLEIEQSIAESAANINGNYICLPVGCWRVN